MLWTLCPHRTLDCSGAENIIRFSILFPAPSNIVPFIEKHRWNEFGRAERSFILISRRLIIPSASQVIENRLRMNESTVLLKTYQTKDKMRPSMRHKIMQGRTIAMEDPWGPSCLLSPSPPLSVVSPLFSLAKMALAGRCQIYYWLQESEATRNNNRNNIWSTSKISIKENSD